MSCKYSPFNIIIFSCFKNLCKACCVTNGRRVYEIMKRYEDLIKQIELYGIIPVVKVENVEDALPLVKALCDGGLKVAEVTFRT